MLREFVLYFSELRAAGGKYKAFSKLIINSLYGRLGMSSDNSCSLVIPVEELEFYFKNVSILGYKVINNVALVNAEIDSKLKLLKKDIKVRKIKNNVALAAAITAKARIKLFRAQKSVIENGGRLLYSDTDSIFAAYKSDVINQQHGEVY